MRKLDQTRNFLSLYLHHVGQSEVPQDYHLWCALSLMAASVGNNVWFEKFKGDPLFPNLYTILLGPSGIGKGKAISAALKFIRDEPAVCLYRGAATKAGMIDILCETAKKARTQRIDPFLHGSRMFYVTPELSMSVGTGPLADDWVKWMTEMFTGDPGEHHESTRTHGVKKMESPCMNWLAGSTEDWLVKSISPDAISGGFFARSIVVPFDYDYSRRVYKPSTPPDYYEVEEHLKHRVHALCHCRGQFIFTPEAEQLDASWYCNRPEPEDEALAPIWQREHDFMIKLSMLCALSDLLLWDGNYDFRIQARHVQAAQKLVHGVRKHVKHVIALSSQTRETIQRDTVLREIKMHREISHSVLLRKVSSKGIGSGLLRLITRDLQDSNLIEIKNMGKGVRYYWKKRFGK